MHPVGNVHRPFVHSGQCTDYCQCCSAHIARWCNTLKSTLSAQSSTSSGCKNKQRVKFVYGPDHREKRVRMPGGMANLLVQPLINCGTQIWRGKDSEISSHVVMSSRQRVDVQEWCVWGYRCKIQQYLAKSF